MPLAESPDPQRDYQEGDAYYRRGVPEPERRAERVRLADYGEGGEVGYAGERHAECE